MSVLVVGTVAFDAIETPFGKTDKIVGGAATYICLSAAFFTKKINLVSVVGGDFPNEAIQMLKNKSVDTKGLQIKEGEKTFFWSGKYHNDMNTRDTLDTQLNVLENFDPIVPEQFQESEFLMLGNLMPSVQKKVLDQMKRRPKLVVLDTMNFWMDNAMENLKKIISKVDLICINDDEVKQLTGLNSLAEGARKILNMGPNYVIVKKGEYGSMLIDKLNTFECPAFPVKKVKDPTGAGDSFAGGLAGYLTTVNSSSFDDIKKAVMYGTATASFSVEGFGINGIEKINYNDIINRVDFINKLL